MLSFGSQRTKWQKGDEIVDTVETQLVPDSSSSHVPSSSTESAEVEAKMCTVCGDKALGYNFNALTCESCKAFFRRNAFKDVFGRCDGTCCVTVSTRSYCKKCRLKKCFAIGMNRNLILSDEQRSMRKRRGRPPSNPKPILSSSCEVDSNIVPVQCGTGTCLSVQAESSQKSPSSSNCSTDRGSVVKTDSDSVEPEKEMRDGGFIEVIEHLYQLPESMRPVIRHLAQAFYSSIESEAPKPMKEVPSQTEFINMADQWVRRLVRLNKKIDDFHMLCADDQIALLKGCMVELLVMLSATSFDSQTNSWKVEHQSSGVTHTISSDKLRDNMGLYAEFLEHYFTFMSSFMGVLRGDRILLMLVVMLSVFSSDRVNVVHAEKISEIQNKYAMLLYNYVQFKYPNNENLFAKLVMKLTDIRTMNESHTKALANMKFEELEPLCAEIYDIDC